MPHIDLPEGVPGIRSAMKFRPETAGPLLQLAEVLLRADNTLSRGERELIASYVSSLNDCYVLRGLAQRVRGAAARGRDVARRARSSAIPSSAPISDKLRALLAIAAKVQAERASRSPARTSRRRASEGATDVEIHDTVLIAAAFCMFNRYVDGLATWAPTDPAVYEEIGRRVVEHGYLRPVEPAAVPD